MTEITRIDNYEFDERFYQKILDEKRFYAPSVTYVLGSVYPQDYGLTQWRGDVGNKRADEILEETSEDGSFVHDAIDKMIKGEKITSETISGRFSPRRSLKVKRCITAFLDWVDEFKPQFVSSEYIIWHPELNYAGTVDAKCIINGQLYIIDFKTSKSIHQTHKLQVTAYVAADDPTAIPALLHLGNTTKRGYSFLEIDLDDRKKFWSHFSIALKMFNTLNPNAQPTSETFPEYFTLPKEYLNQMAGVTAATVKAEIEKDKTIMARGKSKKFKEIIH